MTSFVAFGDSMTEGVVSLGPPVYTLVPLIAPQSYPFKLETMLAGRYTAQTIAVANEGKAGERTVQGVARLATVLGASHPQVVLLMEGVNDLHALGRGGISVAITALERMIKDARASGARVMIATLPPQRPGGPRTLSATLIEPFNSEVKKTAADEGAIVVDIYAGFGGDLTLIGADGLHPTELGYQRIAETFFSSIKASFEVMSIQSFNAGGAERVQFTNSPRPPR